MRPQLPTTTDDEVLKFHPVFEYCAKNALNELNLENEIVLIHHQPLGDITVDFSFERRSTGRIILLAEIKRIKSAVQSTKYRLQAMNYRMTATHRAETPYYLISNLEITDLFRYDDQRPVVNSQIIEGSPFRAGDFSTTNENDFYINLIRCLTEIINLTINDSGHYFDGLLGFETALQNETRDYDKWHQYFIPASYEYIRAAASSFYPFLSTITSRWRAADYYKIRPEKLVRNGLQVDFSNIFCNPITVINDSVAFNQNLLTQAYLSGKIRGDGEDLSAIVNGMLLQPEKGVIETDEELSRLLVVMARDALGRDLQRNELICDPAAGSGRLLIAAIESFSNIMPDQIWANEIEIRFQEILSLHLGLTFASQITPDNAPNITIQNISDLSVEDFSNVKMILLNPPFVRGISSSAEKELLASKIRDLTGAESIVNHGQIGLEAVFLELVWDFIPSGAIIAAIMPHRYLSGLSQETTAFRLFLSEHFGLSHIVSYPRTGLFETVVKQTVIFVGTKGQINNKVKIVNTQIDVDRIDLRELQNGLSIAKSDPVRGVHLELLDQLDLINNAYNGWHFIVGAKKRAITFTEENFQGFSTLDQNTDRIIRGTAGNSGLSELQMLATNSQDDILTNLIPTHWLRPAIRKSDDLSKQLTTENSPNKSFIPPEEAFIPTSQDNEILLSIIKSFLTRINSRKKGIQPKNEVDLTKALGAIKKDLRISPPNSVLIPRGIRVQGRVGILGEEAIVSTNFFVAYYQNREKALLISSWLSSVYGQIQMELYGVDQEGMRKLEGDQIKNIRVPDISLLSDNEKQELIDNFLNNEYINFTHTVIRPTDRLWNRILNKYYGLLEPIDNVFDLLIEMVEDRNP